jgi:hypothetical protein
VAGRVDQDVFQLDVAVHHLQQEAGQGRSQVSRAGAGERLGSEWLARREESRHWEG